MTPGHLTELVQDPLLLGAPGTPVPVINDLHVLLLARALTAVFSIDCGKMRQAQDSVTRVVVPLRNGKVTAKSPGSDMPLEGVSVAEATERMTREMVGGGGIEPPTPGFSVLVVGPCPRLHFQELVRPAGYRLAGGK